MRARRLRAGEDPGRGGGVPGCGTEAARMHGYHERTVADALPTAAALGCG